MNRDMYVYRAFLTTANSGLRCRLRVTCCACGRRRSSAHTVHMRIACFPTVTSILFSSTKNPCGSRPLDQSFVAGLAPGTTIIGARFHPGLSPGLLGLPASELLNQSVPLSALWGSAESARFSRITGASEVFLRANRRWRQPCSTAWLRLTPLTKQ
jgi:hypothetical protein